MADSHPFANAGLSMFGGAERQYAQQGMHATPSKDNLLGGSIAAFLQMLGVGKTSTEDSSSDQQPIVGVPPMLPKSSSYAPVVPNYGFGKPQPYIAPTQQTQTQPLNDQNFIDSFQIPRLK